MRVFKPKYSRPLPEGVKILRRKEGKFVKHKGREYPLTKSGKRIQCEVKLWQIDFEDNIDISRTVKGFSNRAATQRLADRIQDLLNCKATNQQPTLEIQQFLEVMPSRIRRTLIKFGLIDKHCKAAGKPLIELVDDFKASLQAKERSKKYIGENETLLKGLFEGCGFVYWSDISPTKVETYLKKLREYSADYRWSKEYKGISHRRSNTYLKMAKAFCKWMVESGFASRSPLQHLKALKTQSDQRRKCRRALEVDEIRKLLETALEEPVRYGMTGHERTLIYRFAVETGLRANEIRSLKVSSFDFDDLTATVEAQYTKNRNGAVQTITPNLATDLKEFLRNKMPNTKAFGGSYKQLTDKTSKMIQADLEAAGIAYKVDGRDFDFHSLRGECSTLLADSGVHPKVTQEIMRHSDINLTMNTYTHILLGQKAQAIDKIPDLTQPSSEQKRKLKSGTNDSRI